MPTDPTRTDHLGDGAAPPGEATGEGVRGPDAAPSGDGGPAGDGPAASGPVRGRKRRAAKRAGVGLAGVIAFVGIVLVGVLIFLQSGPGREFARGLVVDQIANVFADDAEVSAEGLAGNFLTGARLTGLEVPAVHGLGRLTDRGCHCPPCRLSRLHRRH